MNPVCIETLVYEPSIYRNSGYELSILWELWLMNPVYIETWVYEPSLYRNSGL